MIRRLRQQYSGYGSKSTKTPRLRPWALLGLIVGFEGADIYERYIVESTWKKKRNRRQEMGHNLDPNKLASLAHEIVQQYPRREFCFLSCGPISQVHDNNNTTT